MKLLNLTYGKLLMTLFAALAIGLVGCGDDEEDELDPSIVIDAVSTANGATVEPGASTRLSFVAQKGADGKNLESVRVEEFVNDASTGTTVLDTTDINEASFNFDTGTIPARLVNDETTEYTWQIVVTDRDSRSTTRRINFTVAREDTTTDPDPELPKMISATFTNNTAFMASGSANSSTVNEATADANKANIDLTYFRSESSDSYSFISPAVRSDAALYGEIAIDNYPNNTQFYVVGTSTSRFEALKELDKSEIEAEVDGATLSGWPGNPQGARIGAQEGASPVNNVYGYKLGARAGLIRVISVSGDQMTVEIITND